MFSDLENGKPIEQQPVTESSDLSQRNLGSLEWCQTYRK